MKVCERCNKEIYTRDGDNLCECCQARGEIMSATARKRANRLRRTRHAVLRSVGLVRVHGALGGVYYE